MELRQTDTPTKYQKTKHQPSANGPMALKLPKTSYATAVVVAAADGAEAAARGM